MDEEGISKHNFLFFILFWYMYILFVFFMQPRERKMKISNL